MAITFGNTSDNSSQGTTSWSHNSNGNFLMVGIHETGNSVSGVTYAGSAMTKIGTTLNFAGAGRYLSIWGIVSPTAGSNTIAITGGANHQAGAISISGVNQTTPTSGFNSGTSASSPLAVSITTTVNNAYVVGFGLYITKSTLGTGVTNNYVMSYDTNGGFMRSTNVVSPAGAFSLSVSMTGSAIAGFVGVGINPSSTDYPITAVVGAFTLTGIDTLFHRLINLVTTAGAFTLTGIDTLFSIGKGIIATTVAFVLTGTTTIFTKALTMVSAVGAFTLTGVSSTLIKGITLVVSTGSFILTGIAVRFTKYWHNITKHVSSWTNINKTDL